MKRRPLFRARRASTDPLRIELIGVAKGSERSPILAPTTTGYATGEAVLVEAETEQRPTVLGLIASGRMKPDAGEVLINGRHRAGELRRKVALIDAPDVSDPDPNVITVGVVAEELMFAGLPSNPISARKWMGEHGFADLTMMPIGSVEPSRRVRLLTELASQREGVEGLVIVSPDRHGGRPQTWWAVAEDFARRDFAVLVIAGRASWQVLHEDRTDTVGLADDERDAILAAFSQTEVIVSDAATDEEEAIAEHALGAVDFDEALTDAGDPPDEEEAVAEHAPGAGDVGEALPDPEDATAASPEDASADDDATDDATDALGALDFDEQLATAMDDAAEDAAALPHPHTPLPEDPSSGETNDLSAARPETAGDDAEDAR
ncbi:hypothetical protein [Microbacterium sp. GXS0129]|uniref:hypothetical protein n=1 Tax=Microbacterium sp. GXS0129 TaxID=3377836 RepID=UPI00383A0D06